MVELNCFVCLFDLILYVPITIFQLNRDGSSWVEPVLSYDKCVLLKDHNVVTPVRLELQNPRSRVKHRDHTRGRLGRSGRLFFRHFASDKSPGEKSDAVKFTDFFLFPSHFQYSPILCTSVTVKKSSPFKYLVDKLS